MSGREQRFTLACISFYARTCTNLGQSVDLALVNEHNWVLQRSDFQNPGVEAEWLVRTEHETYIITGYGQDGPLGGGFGEKGTVSNVMWSRTDRGKEEVTGTWNGGEGEKWLRPSQVPKPDGWGEFA